MLNLCPKTGRDKNLMIEAVILAGKIKMNRGGIMDRNIFSMAIEEVKKTLDGWGEIQRKITVNGVDMQKIFAARGDNIRCLETQRTRLDELEKENTITAADLEAFCLKQKSILEENNTFTQMISEK